MNDEFSQKFKEAQPEDILKVLRETFGTTALRRIAPMSELHGYNASTKEYEKSQIPPRIQTQM